MAHRVGRALGAVCPSTSRITFQEVRRAARGLEPAGSCGIMQTMTALSIIIAERAG